MTLRENGLRMRITNFHKRDYKEQQVGGLQSTIREGYKSDERSITKWDKMG